MDDRRRPDILIRNPRGFHRQVILDVAVTGVDSQSKVGDRDSNNLLDDRYKQKLHEYHHVANQNGLQFIPAVFSHAGQIHGEVKRFIRDQICLQFCITEGEVKTSRVDSVFLWWSKCISATICRTVGILFFRQRELAR